MKNNVCQFNVCSAEKDLVIMSEDYICVKHQKTRNALINQNNKLKQKLFYLHSVQ